MATLMNEKWWVANKAKTLTDTGDTVKKALAEWDKQKKCRGQSLNPAKVKTALKGVKDASEALRKKANSVVHKATCGVLDTYVKNCNAWTKKLDAADGKQMLQAIRPEAPHDLLDSLPCATYPAVAFDGMHLANPFRGVLTIDELASHRTIRSLEIGESLEDYGAAGWSPDGRIVGWGSFKIDSPGSWVVNLWTDERRGLWLFDVKTGERWLLAHSNVTLPRWSPDGRYIAVDDRLKNEVVILDVSSLNLFEGLPKLPDAGTGSQASRSPTAGE